MAIGTSTLVNPFLGKAMTSHHNTSHTSNAAFETLRNHTEEWVVLTNGKEFSRILYTNPVCFLGTRHQESIEEQNAKCASSNDAGIKGKQNETNPVQTLQSSIHNVMVLSWITATNNNGRFMFSINRRRHTAALLNDMMQVKGYANFTLSVPVSGMEDLVLNVGSTSGQFGSKFSADHATDMAAHADDDQPVREKLSKRQQKKMRTKRFKNGIPGLEAVNLGEKRNSECNEELFVVQGTVAHLICRAYQIFPHTSEIEDKSATSRVGAADNNGDSPCIDSEHILVLAEVTQAYVHSKYWDSKKKLFRPVPGVPPYLTFFGSQTFGYVVSEI